MQGQMVTGWIKEILIPDGTTGSEGGLVTIEVFDIGEHLHPDFEMLFFFNQIFCARGTFPMLHITTTGK